MPETKILALFILLKTRFNVTLPYKTADFEMKLDLIQNLA